MPKWRMGKCKTEFCLWCGFYHPKVLGSGSYSSTNITVLGENSFFNIAEVPDLFGLKVQFSAPRIFAERGKCLRW